MHNITVYGPLVCGGCSFTLNALKRSFKGTDVVIEKVVIDDPLHEVVLAAKLSIKAQRLGVSVESVEPLTEDEIGTPESAPFVFVDGVFQWHTNIPDNPGRLFKQYQLLALVDAS